MFNPTVEVSQSGRPEQQADFDGLGTKENSPGMSGTNLSRLESNRPSEIMPLRVSSIAVPIPTPFNTARFAGAVLRQDSALA